MENISTQFTAMIRTYSNQTAQSIAQQLHSSLENGIAVSSLEERYAQYGKNVFEEHTQTWLSILYRQSSSLYMLLFYFVVILFLLIGEYSNAVVILMLIVINISVGFYQEFRASQALTLIKKYIEPMSTVIRDGKSITIASSELVPGDIVVLATGKIAQADMRIIEAHNLVLDESVFSGESAPVSKTPDIPTNQEQTTVFTASNIIFAGTSVISGEGKGVVFATGKSSAFGMFTSSLAVTHQSSIEKGTLDIGRFIFKLIIITTICIFVANIFIKGWSTISIMKLLIFSIALALSAIPEALPIIITFALSRGVSRLIKEQVVVKRISSIEDLGGIELLCVDKTGTLTENVMTLAETFPANNPDLLLYGGLTVAPENVANERGFDAALWQKIPQPIRDQVASFTRIRELPFDSIRRRNTVFVKDRNNTTYIITRGSPDDVFKNCTQPIDAKLTDWVRAQDENGRRVLTVAIKKTSSQAEQLTQEESNLQAIGALSFVDPILKSSFDAVSQAKKLGVILKIISGDTPAVCKAVAVELKLITKDDQVVTGAMLEKMKQSEKEELIRSTTVFSRILPQQKAEIIQTLRHEHTVGYLGDGINDVPGLEVADVSLAVYGCADIVREVADIILLKKSLHAIINGIKEGRIIVANTMKYITATISVNLGNFFALAVSSLFLPYVPLLPVQILLINILVDFPLLGISTDNVDPAELQSPKQYTVNSILFLAAILAVLSNFFDAFFLAYFYRMPAAILQTSWFIENILTENAFILSIRSKKFFLQSQRPSLLLLIAVFATAAVAITLPETSFGQHYFSFVSVGFTNMIVILLLTITYFITTETIKTLYFRRNLKSRSSHR